jgi:tRNA wybutosine-synthesizing protein 3
MERETKLPQGFTTKKTKIVQALTLPEKQYFDLSPKGSVDEGIQDLVKLLNDMDGIVTTSSCAGRTSVFLEGQKTQESPADDQNTTPNGQALQAAVPGGKGLGGHWLYVSHEVVDLDSEVDLFSKFGLSSRELGQEVFLNANSRLVKFQFEPMVNSQCLRLTPGAKTPTDQHRVDSSYNDSISPPRKTTTRSGH